MLCWTVLIRDLLLLYYQAMAWGCLLDDLSYGYNICLLFIKFGEIHIDSAYMFEDFGSVFV